jgi:23S rRNA (cytosine1962-C5)-methyltransferase
LTVTAQAAPQTRLRLRISAAAETIVRSGHPWLFADSIHEANRSGHIGEIAVIFDRKDKFLAVGLFDPDSPIRVRIPGGKRDWHRPWLAAKIYSTRKRPASA